MEGFKANPKMKCDLPCFKEGGYVSKKEMKKEERSEEKKDISKDKKMIKKAVGQHEAKQHKGEPKTEIKLKNGGRSKKETGTAKRYDSKAVGMKKDKSDKKAIAKTKKMKPVVETTTVVEEVAPAMATAPSAPIDAPPQAMPAFAPGGQVFGQGVGTMSAPSSALGNPSAQGMGAMNDMDKQSLMRGLQAIGNYCSGGKAY